MGLTSNATIPEMTYRFLGDSGLLVSKLGLGTFMSDESKYEGDFWYNLMTLAYKYGVNFFDCAEAYGEGKAEVMLGKAIEKGIMEGVWSREDLVISTKIFHGTKSGPNAAGLSRKHVIEGTKASLKRLELDYVDVIFCHRSDPHTPIEETVRAMNFVIEQGWAFYWGTSSWSSADIIEACEIADRLGLIRPVAEQPQYNILERSQVDFDLVHLYKKYKLGLAVWSPLSMGILTGKYSAGKPEGSRYTSPAFQSGWMAGSFEKNVQIADKLKPIAEELGCTLAQMSIAWTVSNKNVSTVFLGASRPEQLEETLKASNVESKITPEIKEKIDTVVNFVPKLPELDPFALMRSRYL
ncbi:putative voltage-gated potassium channel subunit beta [Phytophthora citrophthora]|uniref:Voltage-gated potassium channel subunit beta n=1 Tax=Phytophthora citrophthora TaxID=4793 RepID=A0AAD9LG97_9STRA|nr:putative voltage-gated potassium channel subunit beta [Phytophthora citrophthora]